MLVFMLMFVLMTMIVGVMLVMTPWLMPQTECFAVTVPRGVRSQEPLQGYLRAYALRMAVVTLLCALVWPAAFVLADIDPATDRGNLLLSVLACVTMLLPILISFVLRLHYRKLVQEVKEERGWQAEHEQSAALVGPEDFPQPVSLAWNLAYVPLVCAMIVFALTNYDRFPEMIPVHTNLDGSMTEYAPKSLGTVLYPAYITSFLGLVFTLVHWGTIRSKKPIDPDAPASSALAYGRFARQMSQMLVGGGLGLSVLIGVAYYAGALGVMSLNSAAIAMTVGPLAFAGSALAISLRMGQAGARLAADLPSEVMPRDDDSYWLLGTIYFNREDPSILVPKRFGVGWTLNAGRPESWIAVVALVLLVAAFAWGATVLMPS